MKVSVDVLQRVYESLQDQGQRTDAEKEAIDPESHLFIIDAFEMPLWHWSPERGTFEKYSMSFLSRYHRLSFSRVSAPLTMSGSADSRVLAMRDRLNVIKQCVLRNEHFAPSTLPSRDRERLVTVWSPLSSFAVASDFPSSNPLNNSWAVLETASCF